MVSEVGEIFHLNGVTRFVRRFQYDVVTALQSPIYFSTIYGECASFFLDWRKQVIRKLSKFRASLDSVKDGF